MHLTDEQREVIQPLLPQPEKVTTRGRTRRQDREVLDGILWILRTGAQWSELLRLAYLPKSTCHKRFQEWTEGPAFPLILAALYERLVDQSLLDLREAFISGVAPCIAE